MTKGTIVAIVVGVGLAGGIANVRATGRFTGVVNAIGQDSLQITTSEVGVQTIRTDAKTAYMKWITHKPWQEAGIGIRALNVGRCVSVDLRSDSDPVAKIVWINTDRGTVWDPCKSIR